MGVDAELEVYEAGRNAQSPFYIHPLSHPQVLGEASPRGWRQKRRKHGLVMSSARTQQTRSSAIVCPRLKQPTQAQTQSQVRPADTQPTTRTLLNSNSGPKFPHPDYPDPSPGPGEPSARGAQDATEQEADPCSNLLVQSVHSRVFLCLGRSAQAQPLIHRTST